MKSSARGIEAKALKKKRFFTKHDIECTVMISPAIIGFFVFTLYPIVWAISKSFNYYTGVDSQTMFVGFENFINVFTRDTGYWPAVGNSFLFTLGKLPIELPLAFCLALIVSKKRRGFKSARVGLYFPTIISVTVVGLVFTNLFSYSGYVNTILQKIGLISAPIDYFSHKGSALMILIIASVWQTFGINTIYFMVALANVPEEVYESAKLDGAGMFVTLFKITLPLIAPVLATILLLAINGSLQVGDIVLNLTNGAPGGQTEVATTFLLKKIVPGFASTSANIGEGCAAAIINAFIYSGVALIYSKLSSKVVRYY